MARTTIDIDSTILRELKRMQKTERKSMGKLVSELLAQALSRARTAEKKPAFKWISKEMGARVDLSDKEALWNLLDEDGPR